MSEAGKIEKSIHVVSLKKVYYGRKTNRADRAVRLLKKYARRHFKEAEEIIIDPRVNEYIWSRSREKPPRRIIIEFRYDKEEKKLRILLARPSRMVSRATEESKPISK